MKIKTKKIYYISTRDVRKNRADAVHIMLSCQAFSLLDVDVELVTPSVMRDEYVVDKDSIFELYGIENPRFKVTELNTNISEIRNKKTSPYRIVLTKLKAFWGFGYKNRIAFRDKDTIIYSKCYISTIPFIIMKKLGLIISDIVFEVITPKDSFIHRIIYNNSDKIISHLKFVTEDILKFSKTSQNKIFEPPYFTQSEEIEKIKESKLELKEELGLKPNDFYVLYAGKAGAKVKQVWYFIDSAAQLPSFKFLIVGANKDGTEAFNRYKNEKDIDNLEVRPFQPLKEYYKYVKACDLLIGYYPPTHHNKYHLSPGKSGVYFASKNPCLFSDLPSLRSLFPDEIVFYAEPDNTLKLVESIQYVKNNPQIASEKAAAAFDFATISTYHNFVVGIVNFIDSGD